MPDRPTQTQQSSGAPSGPPEPDQSPRCPASVNMGAKRCAYVAGHPNDHHLYASKMAEEWAREGLWPMPGTAEYPLALDRSLQFVREEAPDA